MRHSADFFVIIVALAPYHQRRDSYVLMVSMSGVRHIGSIANFQRLGSARRSAIMPNCV